MFMVVEYEYDTGACEGCWEFETKEKAIKFQEKLYSRLDPDYYWVRYRVEEI